MDSKTINYLVKHPAALLKFQMTGKVPTLSHKAASPLISLLESIPPRDLIDIKGVTINSSLGYTGSRVFSNAHQALHWVKPQYVAASHPADSWRIKSFYKTLTIDDLRRNCKSFPQRLLGSQSALC